ncbi:hypothetical protein [Niveispirillum fermenti]|uniref:hypothetical protein n=1 Tax=Niveispirillum fermenti TaxID=1233113 RepID=UPI003A8765FB
MPDSLGSTVALPAPGILEMFRALAGDWRRLALATAVGVGLMVLALHLVTPQFTASMVVGPPGRSGPAAMGPRAPALSPAAALPNRGRRTSLCPTSPVIWPC